MRQSSLYSRVLTSISRSHGQEAPTGTPSSARGRERVPADQPDPTHVPHFFLSVRQLRRPLAGSCGHYLADIISRPLYRGHYILTKYKTLILRWPK